MLTSRAATAVRKVATATVLTLVGAVALSAQSVECALERSGDDLTGECRGILAEPWAVEMELTAPGHWDGFMSVGDGTGEFALAPYEYSDGPKMLVRTPFGWFVPSRLDLDSSAPQLAWSTDDEAPPAALDLEILDLARSLLADAERWDRADDRVCAEEDTSYSLYCSLAEATRRTTGAYAHRQPALQIIRQVVASEWGDRVVNHRLMDFNNYERTTLAEIMKTFDLARERLLETMR